MNSQISVFQAISFRENVWNSRKSQKFLPLVPDGTTANYFADADQTLSVAESAATDDEEIWNHYRKSRSTDVTMTIEIVSKLQALWGEACNISLAKSSGQI